MKTLREIIQKTEKLIKEHQSYQDDPIGNARYQKLVILKKFLETKGFPKNQEERVEYSLVPYIFQEALYDGIDWAIQDAELDGMQSLFELDFLVLNDGKEREEVSSEIFEKYINDVLEIIDTHQEQIREGRI